MTQLTNHTIDRRTLLKTAAGVGSGIALSSTTTLTAQEESKLSFIEAYPNQQFPAGRKSL